MGKSKRLKPLSNLYHQFGKPLGLTAAEVSVCLEVAGLIELDGVGAAYSETDRMHQIPKERFAETIAKLLKGTL